MNIQILGQYDFDNFTLLNALMDEKDQVNTAVHEYTHFMLANQSVYGTIQYCLNKLVIPPNCKSDSDKRNTAMNFLMSNTLKVQEGTAVFIEATLFLLKSNSDYEKFISDLRNNKQYYNYVSPLCFILEYMKKIDYNEKLYIAQAVIQVALKSMNSHLYDYDGKLFATNKSIQKLVSNKDFSENYLPNRKFERMLKDCRNETSYKDFHDKLLNLAESEDKYDICEIRTRLEKIKKFIIKIFDGSPNLEMYKRRLNQINVDEKEQSSIFLQQLPTMFNEEYVKKISYNLLKQKCNTVNYSTLFLLGGLKNNLNDLYNKMGAIDNQQLQESGEILFFYDLQQKEIFGCILKSDELKEIFEQKGNKYVLLTSYKNYDYKNNCIPNYSTVKGNTYIYCDRTYSNSIPYLEQWKDRIVYYRFMAYKSMIVLLVKINDSSIFMLPMTPMVADEAEKDIRAKHTNMRPITEVKDEEYDPHVIKDERIHDEIDTIVNCLFFINL